ncbi:MAG TPA: DUF5668 domain-containing protein [Bryobacteraceae bacterium]|nr:DUF5668 domain-containing protein [Bryobacteraceae bacterium]
MSVAELARALRGPVTLIAVGVLFAVDHFTPIKFRQTWPALLIVFGLMTLLGREARPPYVPPPPGPPAGQNYLS